MSVYYYDPFYDVERIINDSFGRFSNNNNNNNQGQAVQRQGHSNDVQQAIRPRMDLHENKDTNTVTATFELPGIKKEDVQIECHNGRLTVSAESKISESHEKDGYAIRERKFGRFSRTLTLPQGVKENEVQAAMEHGVLTVTFPKSTPEQAPKKISIA